MLKLTKAVFLFLSIHSFGQLSKHQEDSILSIIDTTTNDHFSAYYYFTLANLFVVTDSRKNLEYSYKSLNHYEKHLVDNPHDSIALEGIHSLKMNIGRSFITLKDYENALRLNKEALNYFLKNKKDDFIGFCYNNIGGIYFDMGDFDMAKKYFSKGQKYQSYISPMIETNLIYIKAAKGNYEQAIDELLIQIEKRDSFPGTQAEKTTNNLRDYLNIGEYYTELKKQDSALAYLVKANNGAIELNNHSLTSVSFKHLGDFFKEVNPQKASQYYKSALVDIEDLPLESEILYALFEISKEQGNYKQGVYYLEKHQAMMDTIAKINDNDFALKFDFQNVLNDVELKDSIKQLKSLERLTIKHQKKEQQSKYVTTVVGIVGSASIVFGILLFIGYSRKKKNNKLLEEKNHIIENSLTEKDVLMKEIHHRVKNNMQMVSSLLFLKSRSTGDDNAKQALKDSHERIKSMQISHQNMYQNDNFESLNISNYLTDILLAITQNIKKEEDQFDVNISSDLLFKVESAQAIGFIIHELISNSIKYAWPDVNAPKAITISIESSSSNKKYKLIYKDNGIGVSDKNVLLESKSLGMKLINSFIDRQLNGTLNIIEAKGVYLEIEFNKSATE